MKGFDVWKLLGGRAPRGYKRGVLNAKEGLGRVRDGARADTPGASMQNSMSPADIATLLTVVGVPLGTFGLARKWTNEKRERDGGGG